jgi:hypothetical protein
MFFVNRVLERIFWLKRDEVTREWRRLHNEELYALYCSTNIIWMIKSRRLRRAGNVARMRREEVHTGFWWENAREGGQLKDLGVEGRIILKWIFERLGVEAQTGLIWLRIGTGGGLLCIR